MLKLGFSWFGRVPTYDMPTGNCCSLSNPHELEYAALTIPTTSRRRYCLPSNQAHQEPHGATGPGDATGEEGEPVSLRDEAAHRRGCGHGGGTQFENHPANRHDATQVYQLLHGGEKRVWGDGGYVGVQKQEENPRLDVGWQVAMKPG